MPVPTAFSILAALLIAGTAIAGTNIPPTVRITSPPDCGLVEPDGNGRTLIEAVANDPDGSIVAVRFYYGSGSFMQLCGVDSIAPYASNCPLPYVVASRFPSTEPAVAGAPGLPRVDVAGVCGCSLGMYQPETEYVAVAVDNVGATTSSDTVQVRPTWAYMGPYGSGPFSSSVTILDPGFDATSLANGDQAAGPGTIGGWTFAGTAGASMGVRNPTAASYSGAAGNGTPTGADGANIAYLAVPAGAADSAQAFQVLPDTLRRYSRYWLSVAVGSPLDAAPGAVSPFDGAVFELWAGTTVIAQGTCSSVWKKGEFFDLLGVAISDQLPESLLGQALSIHVKLGAGDVARSVHFDHVRLVREGYATPGVGVPGSPLAGDLAARAVPNPAFGPAAIEFTLGEDASVVLTVFDTAGRMVKAPQHRALAAGPQRIALPGDLPPGIYFARIEAGARSQQGRFIRLAR